MAQLAALAEHLDGLEKVLADLEPDLMSVDCAQEFITEFSRGEKLCASGRTLVARVVRDAKALAKAAGITEAEAAQSLAASHTAADQPDFDDALRGGGLSADQANAVAKGASANPDKLSDLLDSAKNKSVGELRDEARTVALKAKDPDDLARRQRSARGLRTWTDDLGMACGSYRLTPEVGARVKSILERQAKRLYDRAKRCGTPDHYPAYLADALTELVTTGRSGAPSSTPTSGRADVVIDISYEALMRGVALQGECCEVRGMGPIPVWRARQILEDNAFLKAVFTRGTDVSLCEHFGTKPKAEVKTALEWRFRACVDCGSRFHLEDDHVNPRANRGPTSYSNLRPRCWPCHVKKTEQDRRDGLLGKDPPSGRRK